MAKILRIGGAYFTDDDKYKIEQSSDGKWNVYMKIKPFFGTYLFTFKYLKDAKKYVLSRYKTKGEFFNNGKANCGI